MRFALGEINVICSDLARSLVFYRDVLGFDVVEQEGSAWHLRCGQQLVLLLPVAETPAPTAPYCQMATLSADLLVDDLEAAYHHLRHHHVQFELEWQADAASFILRNPDGLVWEVLERKH